MAVINCLKYRIRTVDIFFNFNSNFNFYEK